MYDKLRKKLAKYGQNIDEYLWEEMQAKSQLISLSKNEVLVAQGSRRKSAYFICSGGFVKSSITQEGEVKGIWFHLDALFPMAVCGDSYFLNEATKYEIRALEDSTVIRLNKTDMDHWVLKYPTFNQFYIRDLVADFMAINEIRAFAHTHSPEHTFTYINSNYPLIVQRVSSKNMAHFLGISPEWYSKLKKRMKA